MKILKIRSNVLNSSQKIQALWPAKNVALYT